MTLLPSTPRQHSTIEAASTPTVRKVSSLLDLKKRIVPSPWRMQSHSNEPAQVKAAGSIDSISTTGSTSNTAGSTWAKLVGVHHSNQTDRPLLSAGNSQPADRPFVPCGNASERAVQAYLRIRPPQPNSSLSSASAPTPNVEILNSQDAVMSSSGDSFNMPRLSSIPSLSLASAASTGIRPNPPTSYSFTEIFDDATDQTIVFQKTTLPLVENLLGANDTCQMYNSLVFAYGVSGGGKTYTVQGSPSGDPGILPRALDTIMNSISGRQTDSYLRPCRLTGLELTPKSERLAAGEIPHIGFHPSAVRKTLSNIDAAQLMRRDNTTLPLLRNYEYSVWVSYAEVYNEKVYDLFDTSEKRKALSLKADRQAGNKYLSGLREIRIWSNEDAQSVLQKGQFSRQVFSTRLNGTSSRSHSIFTIKVVRLAAAADPEDAGAPANVSRMSLVDLAGSERYKNSQTKGERLKEAGNINKSLMVLGQCMEVMRKNQEDKAKGRKPAIVPFRHSKLTELIQTFFSDDGKAVVIAAINPYQTSYEENLNVLRFAAIARQVVTTQTSTQAITSHLVTRPPLPHYQLPSRPVIARGSSMAKNTSLLPSLPECDASMDATVYKDGNEQEVDTMHAAEAVTHDTEENMSESQYCSETDGEDDEYSDDVFVAHLLNEISDLRRHVVQLEIEKDTELMMAVQEVEDRCEEENQRIERECSRRLKEMAERFDYKMDMKIDILARTHQASIVQMQEAHAAEALRLGKQNVGTLVKVDGEAAEHGRVESGSSQLLEEDSVAPTGGISQGHHTRLGNALNSGSAASSTGSKRKKSSASKPRGSRVEEVHLISGDENSDPSAAAKTAGLYPANKRFKEQVGVKASPNHIAPAFARRF
ncbi:MAG: hypothetical protein CYPHOPRED_000760 [Cyphobasidiales sp. Tagirdzhanova-0007]|nr:MAG: hypothetical protein CYPHOPRED_000760 [Cyphobasidiales sp. Tagirdzhanova-0007]